MRFVLVHAWCTCLASSSFRLHVAIEVVRTGFCICVGFVALDAPRLTAWGAVFVVVRCNIFEFVYKYTSIYFVNDTSLHTFRRTSRRRLSGCYSGTFYPGSSGLHIGKPEQRVFATSSTTVRGGITCLLNCRCVAGDSRPFRWKRPEMASGKDEDSAPLHSEVGWSI